MGCTASHHANPIDAALIQALHAAKKRRGKKEFTFNELLLKFSSMAGGFKRAREYFDRMDLNGDKLIDLEEFLTMAPRVGLDMAVEDLKHVFKAADIDNSTKIDVFEFMLVFVVIQLLSPERAQHLPVEIQKTLEIVEDAFCCFDASEDGYLEPSEVAEVLCTSNTPGRTTRALADKLFAQLDFDGSGGISFKEFLIGLEKMVMEEYLDDDEGEGPTAAEEAEERELQARAKQLAAQQSRKRAAGRPAAIQSPGGGGGGSGSGGGGGRRSSAQGLVQQEEAHGQHSSSAGGGSRRSGEGHHRANEGGHRSSEGGHHRSAK